MREKRAGLRPALDVATQPTPTGTPPAAPLRVALICLALVVLVGLAYGRVAANQFIDYDDPVYITGNSHVRAGLTLDTVGWAFTTGENSNWHPLTWLSHALDVSLFGLDPAGHHLLSVALHAGSAVLLLLAFFRMTGALWRSAIVAALFALHPLHVESVAWAAERKDVLSTFFWMLLLLVYAGYARGPRLATRVLLSVVLGLGLLAKPMLVTAPLVLLLLDIWPLGRWPVAAGARRWRPPAGLIFEKLPLFVLVAASSVVTFVVQQRGGAVSALDQLPLGARLANAVVAYVTYLLRTFWPLDLGILYPLPASVPQWKVLGAGVVLAVISVFAVQMLRRRPFVSVGWGWYVIVLVPVIGLVQVGVQASADRYTYVPLIGVFLALVWGAATLFGGSRRGRAAQGVVAALAIVACAGLTWRQVGFWRDSATLFERTLAITSNNYVLHTNLGGVYLREGRVDDAARHLSEALRIRPDHAAALSNMGLILQGKGKLGSAIELYRHAVRVAPKHLEAWLNLGNALGMTGDLDGAIAAFREAERLQPGAPSIAAAIRTAQESKERAASAAHGRPAANPEALAAYERGNALRDKGRLDEAVAEYRQAVQIDPLLAPAHNNLGSVLGRQGRGAEAIAELSRAIEIAPDFVAAHNNLGIAYAMQGDFARAAQEFAEVLRLDPKDVGARFNLGSLYMKTGRVAEAIGHFEEILRIDPKHEGARRALEAARRAEAP